MGRNKTKLRPQLILLLGKRIGRSVGQELAALGYIHKLFLHCRREDSLRDPPLCASSCKSAVYRKKAGYTQGRWGTNPATLMPKKGFSSSKAVVPTLPAGLGPTTAPLTSPPWDQGCCRVCRAQPTQQELGKKIKLDQHCQINKL